MFHGVIRVISMNNEFHVNQIFHITNNFYVSYGLIQIFYKKQKFNFYFPRQ